MAVSIIPPWQWGLVWLGSQVIQCCGTAALGIAGIAGRARWGRTIMIITLMSISFIFLICAVGYYAEHRERDALFLSTGITPSAVLAIGVMYWEARILEVFSACAAAFFLLACFHYTILFPHRWLLITTLLFGLNTWLLVLVSFGIFIRRRALTAARRLVAADTAAYGNLWSNLMNDARSSNSLVDLCSVAEKLTCQINVAPRQCRRKASDVSHYGHCVWNRCVERSFLGGEGVPDSVDCSQGVCSLDQLFVQAQLLDPILKAKVKEWATISSGCFPACKSEDPKGGVMIVRWNESKTCDSKLQICWGKIKSVSRAVEKLVRSYAQVNFCLLLLLRSKVSRRFDYPCCVNRKLLRSCDLSLVG